MAGGIERVEEIIQRASHITSEDTTLTLCSGCLRDAITAALAQAEAEIERTNDAYEASMRALAQAERERDDLRKALGAAVTEVERLNTKEIRQRIECASCHKAPTDDPGLALKRKNVKGVPGVFLCQFCDSGGDAALAQAELEIERTNDAYEASMRRMNAAEAALARVRAALQKIADGADNHWCRAEARAALEGRK